MGVNTYPLFWPLSLSLSLSVLLSAYTLLMHRCTLDMYVMLSHFPKRAYHDIVDIADIANIVHYLRPAREQQGMGVNMYPFFLTPITLSFTVCLCSFLMHHCTLDMYVMLSHFPKRAYRDIVDIVDIVDIADIANIVHYLRPARERGYECEYVSFFIPIALSFSLSFSLSLSLFLFRSLHSLTFFNILTLLTPYTQLTYIHQVLLSLHVLNFFTIQWLQNLYAPTSLLSYAMFPKTSVMGSIWLATIPTRP